MKERTLELFKKVAFGEITPESAQTELWNLFSVIGSASDIKCMTQFIRDSTKMMTSGNYMHRIAGISHAADQIDKVVDDVK